jgi:hypothetical protein
MTDDLETLAAEARGGNRHSLELLVIQERLHSW